MTKEEAIAALETLEETCDKCKGLIYSNERSGWAYGDFLEDCAMAICAVKEYIE
jgi:hypothetical protein